MWTRHFLLVALLVTTSWATIAFERPFPAHAKRGSVTPANFPMIVIDGKTRTMSAAARIINQDNLITMPASVRGSNIIVNYTETDQGDIDRIWILSKEEASQILLPPAIKPFP